MNRTTVAALVATAVVGVIGGTVSAVVRGDAPGRTANAGPTSSGAPSTTVLYAGAKVIHDGGRTVTYRAPFDTPDRLARTADGYLIAHNTSPQEPSSALFHVGTDGTTRHIADVLGRWDLDPERDTIVAVDLESGRLQARTLDGTVTATWDGPLGAQNPVWTADDKVLVSTFEADDGIWSMRAWDPRTGSTTRLDSPGYEDLASSADGTLISGAVGMDGLSVPEKNVCMTVHGAAATVAGAQDNTSWNTCDWRLNMPGADYFSPDGKRVLAIPSESDGFGPGRLATFSASKGPGVGLQQFDAPPATMDATWLDGQHVVVKGATDFDLDAETGTWLKVCDLGGSCTDLARRAHGDLVVGEQG
ncbi:MAG TPA: hypothetical protein VFO98_06320 [Marmoricola sp.]|jgi:hypothetical protein|nr:hypothetical protein [Marmoricola sp.]